MDVTWNAFWVNKLLVLLFTVDGVGSRESKYSRGCRVYWPSYWVSFVFWYWFKIKGRKKGKIKISRGLTLWAGKFRLRSGSYASLSRIQTLPITLVELSCPVCWLLVSILQYVRFTVNSSLDSYSTRGSPGSSKHLQWRWRSISYGYQKTLKSADLTS